MADATRYEQTVQGRRLRMDEAGGALEAAIALAKEQVMGLTSPQLFLVAAVEIVEPSPRPVYGDEPVREQRVTTGYVPNGSRQGIEHVWPTVQEPL